MTSVFRAEAALSGFCRAPKNPRSSPGSLPVRRLIRARLALARAAPAAAPAQTFPSKPIRFIVPFASGSAKDTVARLIGERIADATKQPVITDSRPGASGFLAAEAVAKAPADGYTVLISTNTLHAANQSLFRKLPHDPIKEFAPVALIGTAAMIAVVNPSVTAKSVAELTATAKSQPGRLNFGYGSSSSRASVEMYKQMAGLGIVGVRYKSNPQAVTDLVGGTVNLMIAEMTTLLPQVKAAKVRALAVSSAKHVPIVPDLPTMDEAGVKDYDLTVRFAACVPAGTPPDVIQRLNEPVRSALASDKLNEYFVNTGGQVAPSTPAELATFTVAETAKWGGIVKAAKIEPE
jgi:tripartite-type tricarboxylate transporter receptor subunit TctC